MTTKEIATLLSEKLGGETIKSVITDSFPETIEIEPTRLVEVCTFLHDHESCYFDLLECITALHNPEENRLELFYNLYSIPKENKIMLKVVLALDEEGDFMPEVDSVSQIWKAANWYEREAYDLLGVNFKDHPDLRRILLPADWEGFPLRKNYQLQKYYRGIKVEY